MNAPVSERGVTSRAVPRLSVMFSLEIASIAAYLPLLSLHAREGLGLTPLETSLVFATGPVTAVVAPPIAGFLVDRALRADRALAVSSLLRAGALFLAARAGTFGELVLAMALHGFFSGQNSVFVSTIAFTHLPDAKRFGLTRVWGTLSWVLMILAVAGVLERAGAAGGQIAALRYTFYVGALTAVAQGAYALTLPPTRPRREHHDEKNAFGAQRLFRSPRFVAALVVALLYGSLTQLNLMLQGLFFADASGLGLSPAAAGRATTVSQLLELALFPLLGIIVERFGIRRVVLVGIGAWVLRYAAYYAGAPTWFVVSAQVLHGLNFVMGFVGLQLAVELMAPAALRGRAQAAFFTTQSGIGCLLGQLGCGALLTAATGSNGRVDWPLVFLGPLVVAVLATAITAAWVKNPERLDAAA